MHQRRLVRPVRDSSHDNSVRARTLRDGGYVVHSRQASALIECRWRSRHSIRENSQTPMKILLFVVAIAASAQTLEEKSRILQRTLMQKPLVDGLYVSIAPAAAAVPHTVDDPGNVIHAGVWTGRYLAGVAYHYAVTRDPAI